MQTHEDKLHAKDFMDRLEARADQMVRDKASEITAGKEGEQPLAEWQSEGVAVRHMPDDEQGILRIGAGGLQSPVSLHYCTIRGDLGLCIELLEKAIKALRAAPTRPESPSGGEA